MQKAKFAKVTRIRLLPGKGGLKEQDEEQQHLQWLFFLFRMFKLFIRLVIRLHWELGWLPGYFFE